jgi:hypothetical protein
MKPITSMITLAGLLQLGAACGSSDDASSSAPESAAGSSAGAGAAGARARAAAGGEAPPQAGDCNRATIEADFQASPLAGPGVQDEQLADGDYLISTTYLQLDQAPEAQQRFGDLMSPIMADLQTRDGLLALSLGSSPSCGVARTLAVWRDDMAMLGFVSGEAHSRAIGSVGQVSRGGSIVTHWLGDASQASWPSAAQHIGADDGPFY